RIFDGEGRWGHAFSSWGDPDLSRRLIRSALTALRESHGAALGTGPAPRPTQPFPSIEGVLDPAVFQERPARKRSILEQALKRVCQGPSFIQAAWRDGIARVALVNSRGLTASFHRTLSLATLTRSGAGGPTLVAERVGCRIGLGEIAEAAEELLRLEAAEQR